MEYSEKRQMHDDAGWISLRYPLRGAGGPCLRPKCSTFQRMTVHRHTEMRCLMSNEAGKGTSDEIGLHLQDLVLDQCRLLSIVVLISRHGAKRMGDPGGS